MNYKITFFNADGRGAWSIECNVIGVNLNEKCINWLHEVPDGRIEIIYLKNKVSVSK